MAEIKKYLHTIDAAGNKIINVILNPLTTADRITLGGTLGVADEGYSVFDTTLDKLYFWDGASWITENNISSAIKIDKVAGENINGGKAVWVDTDGLLYLFDITNTAHYGKCLGVSETSVLTGETCTVVISGTSNLIGSGWLPGVVYYVSATSILTSTTPATGIFQPVGVGISNDQISINVTKSYIRI